jgi:hypothetical protein
LDLGTLADRGTKSPEEPGRTVLRRSSEINSTRGVSNCAHLCLFRRVVGPKDVAALAVDLMTTTAVTGATFDIDGANSLWVLSASARSTQH